MNQTFIREHREDDIRELALQAHRYSGIDVPFCVQQIAGWQTARRKLPTWAATEGILFPVHLSMEQCSSEQAAAYKRSICKPGHSLTDLTAGFGVDVTVMGRAFEHVNYVERNAELCDIARNNLPLLGIRHFTVFCTNAEDVLEQLPHQSLIYLDPARRDNNGGKVVAISDCTPDLSALQDRLLAHADCVMAKLSPMLDLTNILRELHHVSEIHIVSVDGECKEVLVMLQGSVPEDNEPQLFCVNIVKGKPLVFRAQLNDKSAPCIFADTPGAYLYEPNASIMKAGCFRQLATHYGLLKLHPESHLFTSDALVPDFPGRTFRIRQVMGLKDKSLRSLGKANLTVRNFPATVAELRKRLKLRDGGSDYLFATTLADGSHVILCCEY